MLRINRNIKLKVISLLVKVYNIQSYGFKTKFLKVLPQMHNINVKELRLIESGFSGDVYLLDKHTIVKFYYGYYTLFHIFKYYIKSAYAYKHKMPTAAPYNIVATDKAYGITFEYIPAQTLYKNLQLDDLDLNKYCNQLAMLARKTSKVKVHSPYIKNHIDSFYKIKPETIERFLPKCNVEHFMNLIKTLPKCNNLLHSDLHFNNVILYNENSLIIDWDTMSKGHPIFELSRLYIPYIVDSRIVFSKVSKSTCHTVFYNMINCYFGCKKLPEDLTNVLNVLFVIECINMDEIFFVGDTDYINRVKQTTGHIFDSINISTKQFKNLFERINNKYFKDVL